MACATYGLVMGGLIGGPVAKVLLKKKNISVRFWAHAAPVPCPPVKVIDPAISP